MPININLTGVKTAPTPLPPGYFQAEVNQCEIRQSQSGNDYVAWGFTVTEGEFAGKKAWSNNSLQPQALWSFKKTMIALGFPKEELEGNIQFEPQTTMGAKCTLLIVQEEWQGETRGRVSKVMPAGVTGAVL